ncbi:MAG TPA: hypothetical protein PKE31_18605 [Pseudomonadota bacterium]|jgi:hypothetical protein|nr:hypothetical protein [Pseudomonadota bacterium]
MNQQWQWLKCKVVKGMFSDELTVIIQALDGETISAFVPRDRVECSEPSVGRVKVRVFDSTGQKFAVLPNETQTILSVHESALAAA